MAIVPILQKEDATLRKTAKPVPAALFGTPELDTIIKNMEDTLDAEPDGVAIAAPQIGISHRIFLVRYDRMHAPTKEGESKPAAEVGVFVNPSFVRLSKKSDLADEGCLSVRNIYGKTKRKDRATMRAYDASGKAFQRGAGGLLAQAFQHEMDHLDGVLFIDHATELVEITDENRQQEREARRERRLTEGRYE